MKRTTMMNEKKIDLYDLFTKDELKSVSDIFLEAYCRKHGSAPEIFEIETNIIFESEKNGI
tara:strand:+ start:27 stop:209 length:183 start_codon:yes stop_codon:yes gene_type:complete